MITLRITEIAKQRLLGGGDILYHDLYNDKHFLKYESLTIQSCRNGFIVSFCDEKGKSLIATDHRVDHEDTLSINMKGHVEIKVLEE